MGTFSKSELSLLREKHWKPGRAQPVRKRPEEAGRQMGPCWHSVVVASKPMWWNRIRLLESRTQTPHFRRPATILSMGDPSEVFLLPCEVPHDFGHKRDRQILPQLKPALHCCHSTVFSPAISDVHLDVRQENQP